MTTIRLTAAQALVRYLVAQEIEPGEPFIAGVWAIFGHGNVAGLGEALYGIREKLPTWRGQNEQSMAHAAIAYAKAKARRRAMVVTSSIGPGATNMVTAAALAHVNRLPVLFLPGDVFANRAPDPVLQQIEDFGDGTVSVNDCFAPVSRYFDRIQRPEQLLNALPRAMATMTDPAICGPVTLAFCQDVQTEAFDWPESYFEPHQWKIRRQRADAEELAAAAAALRSSRQPLIIAGGGVLYSGAENELCNFAEHHNIPVAETQAGKSALHWDHKHNLGSIGVTGGSAANDVAAGADLVFAIGTRLQDFTTGSWALFKNPGRRLLSLNVTGPDAGKHQALTLVADAGAGLEDLSEILGDWQAKDTDTALRNKWNAAITRATAAPEVKTAANALPSDAQVIGAVQRSMNDDAIVVCAAGGLPGELHKLWRASKPQGYHLEYGYSCMGYEIAGGLGVKMAHPARDVVVMVGDGSYMMMNSEVVTSVMLGLKLTIVVLDNRGFGCINRLQMATGGANFNNLLADTAHEALPQIDFAAHAASLGAAARKTATIAELEDALVWARSQDKTTCIVIDTDPLATTEEGGHWWDVPVPEVSTRAQVDAAREGYNKARQDQRLGD